MIEVTLARCEKCGQYYQASEHHKCLLKPTQSNIINAINKATEDAKKPQLIKPLWVESLEKEIRADERARIKEEFKKYHRLEAKFTLNQCKEKDGLYYIDVTELFYGLVDQVLEEQK